MRVHVAVVGHVDRVDRATSLAQALGASLHLDDGRLGCWGNHTSALAYGAETGATHVITIEDDALPIDDFLVLAHQAIALRPNDPIGLYVGRQRPRGLRVAWATAKADELGASWLSCNELLWGVATAFPAADIPGLLAHDGASDRLYDQRVGSYYRSLDRPVYYTWPSLVDHEDGPSVISERSQRPAGRVAHRVGIPQWNDTTSPIAN